MWSIKSLVKWRLNALEREVKWGVSEARDNQQRKTEREIWGKETGFNFNMFSLCMFGGSVICLPMIHHGILFWWSSISEWMIICLIFDGHHHTPICTEPDFWWSSPLTNLHRDAKVRDPTTSTRARSASSASPAVNQPIMPAKCQYGITTPQREFDIRLLWRTSQHTLYFGLGEKPWVTIQRRF